MQYLIPILTTLIILLVLVLIHEAGHFFAAKFFGIRVDEFGFGLPPRLWGKKIGETIYSLNWIPAGGFVKLLGEDEDHVGNIKEKSRSFAHKPPYVRAIVASAGVIMNLVLTLVIFAIIYSVGGPIDTGRVLVVNVAPNSPAAQASLKEGDIIAQINDTALKGPADLRNKVYEHLGQPVNFTIVRGSETFKAVITPRKDPPANEGALGIANANDIQKIKYPVWEAPIIGTQQAYSLTVQTYQALGSAVGNIVTKQEVPQEVGGAVKIVYYTNLALKVGFDSVLILVGLLSLNLALINILPIPALDGGRLFFILMEAVTRRKVSPAIERWIHTTGFALLLILIVLITFKDISDLLNVTALGNQIKSFFH